MPLAGLRTRSRIWLQVTWGCSQAVKIAVGNVEPRPAPRRNGPIRADGSVAEGYGYGRSAEVHGPLVRRREFDVSGPLDEDGDIHF
ncbi:hypothetical protein AK812_SmicGene21359 [Symbiodinium microadriaticum]|uniref:Uncharacterized protein n=1 Tax=Symbiodinium microadriaticum TaxID=2951 RepID=A0A1Q9DMI1_SYMMI|nr:hypothetical protein AK812_SmicGene21359 [Symbiodinium microadriaticum]